MTALTVKLTAQTCIRPAMRRVSVRKSNVRGIGLCLEAQWRSTERVPGAHDLLMMGPAGGRWHFELTHDPENPIAPAPTVDDLFVVNLGEAPDEDLVRRLVEHGGTRVASHNPHWDEYGVTAADPDGYRLVLCSRTWG